MKFHRDAPAELAAPPRFTTHNPPAVTWRSDLIQVVIAAGAVLGFGAFLVISVAVLLRSWTVLGVGLWLTGLGSLTPFMILAYMIIRELSDEERAYVAKGASNYISYVARFRADGNQW